MPIAPRAQSQSARTNAWWRILRTGLGFYVGGLLLLVLTENPALFPTVVLLGSFMVPAAYVAFFYEHRHLSELSLRTTILSFFYGGVLGVFAVAVLEPLIIWQLDLAADFAIGMIEECAKLLGVLVIARRERHDAELDGLILGVAAGTGFAALESTGYAFGAFVRSGGNLSLAVAVMLLRGLFAPWATGPGPVYWWEFCSARARQGTFTSIGRCSGLMCLSVSYTGSGMLCPGWCSPSPNRISACSLAQ